jgi:serralysin
MVEAEGIEERAPELSDEEIAVIAAEKEGTIVDDSGDPVASDGDGEIRYTLGSEDEIELTDGEFEVTMIEDDGSSPCPETTDDNGDPLYCIYETVGGVTPAPAPTLTDGILNVTGTAGDDKIRISIGKDTSKLAVKVNGAVTLFSLASVTKIKVDGLAGDDDICIKQSHGGIGISAELIGGDGNDKIRGGNGNDSLNGGAGKDKLHGGAGDDVLQGGDGNDKLHGGRGDDSILGGDGSDKVRGGGGNDMLDGSKGRDKIRGGAGHDGCLDHGDALIDAKKAEKAARFAMPIWWSEDDGSGTGDQGIDVGDDAWWNDDISGDDSGALDTMLPIWWDPENPDAQPGDDVEQIVIDDGSGEVPSDSPEDLIMY